MLVQLEADAARNAVLDLGGPEALSYDDVVALYEELTAKPLAQTHVPVAELERYAEASGATERSFAAVLLSAAHGGMVDMKEAVAASGIRLTSLREFAASQLAAM